MSEPQGPTRPDTDAEPIELEPRPKVVRLNRRAIFVAGGLATAVILASVFTLSERSRRTSERRDQMPGATAAPDRFWDSQSDGVPRLPVPPSPPAPATAVAEREVPPVLDSAGSPQLLEPAAETDQTLRRAFASRPVVYEGRVEPRTTRPGVERPAAQALPPTDPASVLAAAKELATAGHREDDPLVSQNLQREKAE